MIAPPRLASALLRCFCAPERLAETRGDLREAFERWMHSRGVGYARRRYWRETLLVPFWRNVSWWRAVRDAATTGKAADEGDERIAPERTSPQGTPPPSRPAPDLIPASPKHPGEFGRDVRQDIRYALRALRRSPGYTLTALLILAAGIGGGVTVFTLADTLFLEPPPHIREPEKLVGFEQVMDTGQAMLSWGYYDYAWYRERAEVFSGITAYTGFPGTRGMSPQTGGEIAVGEGEDIVQALAWVVSGNYFDVLGTSLARGGGFTLDDTGLESGRPEVIISHGFWRRQFGEDPGVLERPLHLNGHSFRVVGIAPEGFRGVNPLEVPPDLFLPILAANTTLQDNIVNFERFDREGNPTAGRSLVLVARLAPGVDVTVARTHMAVLQEEWEAEFGAWSEAMYDGFYRVRLRSDIHSSPPVEQSLTFLALIVGAVFLIACANIAILLLARTSARQGEIGIRTALGAGRIRIVRQVLTECLLLSGIGGVLGIGVAVVAVRGAAVTLPWDIGARIAFRPDATVILFAVLLATLAAVLFGTGPAWSLSRLDPTRIIHRSGPGWTRTRLRNGLVVGQSALCIVLLVIGGLLARSLDAARDVELGFEPDHRILMNLRLGNHGYSETEGRELITATLDRLAAEPGVAGVSTCHRRPFWGSWTMEFSPPGTGSEGETFQSAMNLAGPGYCELMGIDLIAGREFDRDDNQSTPPVAVVSEEFARRMWPGENPLGKTYPFLIPYDEGDWTIVGVARDAIYYNIQESTWPMVYLPHLQLYQGRMSFVVKTHDDPRAMLRPVELAMRELDPNLAIEPLILADLAAEECAPYRIWGTFVALFAALALLLSAAGLYGVQAFLITRRKREIGVRMALGSTGRQVLRTIIGRGLFLGGLGATIGILAALWLERLVRGMLFGVSPHDPTVLIAVPLILMAVCALASLVPALQASRVNPVEVLRQE